MLPRLPRELLRNPVANQRGRSRECGLKPGSTPNAAKFPPCAQRSSLLVTRFASFTPMPFSTSAARLTSYKDSREADPFLFAPDSEMWRVNRERCGLIYGPAAAILQLAHPRIAQGVYDHSNFRYDTMGRLRRTLSSTNKIAFGRTSQARAVSEHVASRHRKVRGQVFDGIDGARTYSAFEPELLLWVLATLITAALNGYELIYGELPVARKEAFYRDMCRFGTYFGVPESLSPKDWPAFDAYYTSMVDGELLASHPICGELARAVVHPRDTVGAGRLGTRHRLCCYRDTTAQSPRTARLDKHHSSRLLHAAGSSRAAENISRPAVESPILPRVLEGDRRASRFLA